MYTYRLCGEHMCCNNGEYIHIGKWLSQVSTKIGNMPEWEDGKLIWSGLIKVATIPKILYADVVKSIIAMFLGLLLRQVETK